MLKHPAEVKETERLAAEALRDLLEEIPPVALQSIKIDQPAGSGEADLVAEIDVAGQHYVLVCEVRQSGQPRFIRNAIHQLRDYLRDFPKSTTPVVIAPYLSSDSRQLCIQNGVSFLDLEGNVRLEFGTVFIDRLREDRRSPEVRELKSVFRPKSAQVLRVLFRDPTKHWKVVDLAKAASVSLGHASNVRNALRNREWGEVGAEGFYLRSPNELLDAWKSAYVPPVVRRLTFYTTAHGERLDSRVKELFDSVPENSHIALGSFSAAKWIAPYGRTSALFLWSEEAEVDKIRDRLELSSSLKGENVVVSVTQDRGIFFDAFAAEYRIRCTSPLQTYLDLSKSGERGEEAAEHLRRLRLSWQR